MDGITRRAGERLKALLKQKGAASDQCLRYLGSEDGEDMMIDRPHPTDERFEYGGRTVLLVDAKSSITLAGRTLDYQDGRFCLT